MLDKLLYQRALISLTSLPYKDVSHIIKLLSEAEVQARENAVSKENND